MPPLRRVPRDSKPTDSRPLLHAHDATTYRARALARLTPVDQHPSNALLSALSPADRARLSEILEPMRVAAGQILYEARAIRHVYFPLDCLVSLVAPLTRHPPVEVALVGREGMVCASL